MNTRTACLASTAPRAVLGARVFANTDPKAMIAQLQAAFEAFKVKNDGKVDELADNFQSALDGIQAQISAGRPNGGADDPASLVPPEPEYSRTFASYFRSGENETELRGLNASGRRAEIRAAMQVGTDNAGGYLAPVEWDRRINKALTALSPMRRLARVIPTTVRAYSTL